MAKIVEEYKIYQIPENFAQEGYVFQGRIRIRGLIDLFIVMIPFAVLLLILDWDIRTKLFVLGIPALPVGIAAAAGIGGDALTEYLLNGLRWKRNQKNGVMKYDPNPQPFYQSAADVLMSDKIPMDELVTRFQKRQKAKLEKRLSREYVEGKNFIFSEDKSISRYKSMPRKSEAVPTLNLSKQSGDLFAFMDEEKEQGREEEDDA